MSESFFQCTSHQVPCQHIRNYARSTAVSQEEILHLAVKQYTPLDASFQKGDVTVIAGHANGCPKELYEPLWDELYQWSKQSNAFRIRSIWIADVANEGVSGVMNERKIGNEPSWFDASRDLLLLINHFREQMPRPIVGLGHSMGASIILNLALIHPRLFTTVMTVEPIVNGNVQEMNFRNAYGTTFKKDVWRSREDAVASFQKSPLSHGWDPRVIHLWKIFALRELPTLLHDESTQRSRSSHAALTEADKPVTLTTTKHQEVLNYARSSYPRRDQQFSDFVPTLQSHHDLGTGRDRNYSNAFYRPEATLIFNQLQYLRPTCLFIYGSKSPMKSASVEGRADKLRVTGTGVGGSGGCSTGAVKEVVTTGGHFLPLEVPREVGRHMAEWLSDELGRWQEMEMEEERQMRQVEAKMRSRVDDDWTFWMKKHYGKQTQARKTQKGKGESGGGRGGGGEKAVGHDDEREGESGGRMVAKL